MKILGLISSENDPASRFRIIQYQKYFINEGHQLNFTYPRILREADAPNWTQTLNNITGINKWRTWDFIKQISRTPYLAKQVFYNIIWQNRLIIPNHSFIERQFYKPFVFDFDDAIWLTEGDKSFQKTLKKATIVFAGNEYLASYASQFSKNIKIIPTTVDTEIFKPLHIKPEYFTIGWIGTEENQKYLRIIKPAILDFLQNNTDARFVIISNKPFKEFEYDNRNIFFKKWNRETENEDINSFSIGIMPLEDNEWTKGKCSYKLLQYMACGKPVIASPVGMNIKLLNDSEIGIGAETKNEWLIALNEFKKNESLYHSFSKNGREFVESNYSIKKYSPIILENFKKIL